MISDANVKQLFLNSQSLMAKHLDRRMPPLAEFYRGKRYWENDHPDGCTRHLSVFNEFSIIPKFCFNCYKVLIEPRTVVELFKLMMVFHKIELPNDNTRKCIIETRKEISGTYKGFIYCGGMGAGKEMLKLIQNVVSEEISSGIPISLKRGCSEYALVYPEYAHIEQDKTIMGYKEEWQAYEDTADKKLAFNTRLPGSDTYNRSAYNLTDAQVMITWLKYAAAIGDVSYLKISLIELAPLQDVERPFHTHPADE